MYFQIGHQTKKSLSYILYSIIKGAVAMDTTLPNVHYVWNNYTICTLEVPPNPQKIQKNREEVQMHFSHLFNHCPATRIFCENVLIL